MNTVKPSILFQIWVIHFKIDLAIAYASWGTIGIVGTALGGMWFYKQKLNAVGWLGIVVVCIAIVVVKTG